MKNWLLLSILFPAAAFAVQVNTAYTLMDRYCLDGSDPSDSAGGEKTSIIFGDQGVLTLQFGGVINGKLTTQYSIEGGTLTMVNARTGEATRSAIREKGKTVTLISEASKLQEDQPCGGGQVISVWETEGKPAN